MKKVKNISIALFLVGCGFFSINGFSSCNNGGGEDIPCECNQWKDVEPKDGCCDVCGHVFSHCVHH